MDKGAKAARNVDKFRARKTPYWTASGDALTSEIV